MTPRGLALLHEFESCRLEAYPDPGSGGDPWTIGWGATTYEDGSAVRQGDRITQARADELLEWHVGRKEADVDDLVQVELSPAQRDALVSFHYNTGALGRSTLLRLLNRGEYLAAAEEFPRWVFASGKRLRGLERRRDAERELFLYGTMRRQ